MIPREFVTRSRVVIICNDWKTLRSWRKMPRTGGRGWRRRSWQAVPTAAPGRWRGRSCSRAAAVARPSLILALFRVRLGGTGHAEADIAIKLLGWQPWGNCQQGEQEW